MEYLCLIAEIETLKEQLKALQPPKKPPRIPCPHTTSKGSPCKKYCAPNLNTCKVHGKPPKPPKTPKEKPKKVSCTGINLRGNPCKRKVLTDCTYCERHDPSLPVKVSVKKQKNKQPPQHNHGIGEVPVVPCGLCGTHGDLFDPGVTEATWVDEAEFWARRGGLR